MNLIGYLSRNNHFPAPLISVVSTERGFYAFFPSGDWVKLIDVESIEELKDRPTFINATTDEKRNSVPRLAFGVSRDNVFVGSPVRVSMSLQDYLTRTDGVDAADRQAIEAFLQILKGLLATSPAEELVKTLAGLTPVVARIVPRKLKNQRGHAETLLVQRSQRGRIKTLYRKGIPLGKSAADVRIASTVAEFLQQAAAA